MKQQFSHLHRAKSGLFEALPNEQRGTSAADGTSSFSIFVTTIKGYVGVGILSIPFSFYQGGLAFSLATYLLIGFLSLHTMLLIVDCKNTLLTRGRSVSTFSDLGGELFGRYGTHLIDILLLGSQIAYATSVVIFVSTNLASLLDWPSGVSELGQKWIWMSLILPILILLSLLRSIKWLTPINVVALCIFMFGFVVVCYFGMSYRMSIPGDTSDDIGHVEMLHTNIFDCTSTIALAIYSFAAIGMVLPMEESAKDKHNFPIVFAAGTWMMVAGLIMFGAIGYICFGDQIESIILMNLDDTMHQTVMLHALKKVIQIGFIIGALFGYPMCLWPVIQRLESMIFFKQPPTIAHSINSVVDEEAPQELTPRHSIQETGSETETDVKVITNPSSLKVNCGLEMKRNLLRIGLVFGTVILAVVVPSFDLFISIIGATFGTSLMFIVPPVMHIQVQKLLMQEPEQSRYKIKAVMIKDIILAVVGGFALLLCTSVTVRNIVLHYVKHTE